MSSAMLLAVAAITIGGTGAFFSDTEQSTGNVFTAGAIDLTVDHQMASYNNEVCANDCVETGGSLITNGGFEDPSIANNSFQIYPVGIPGWIVESGDGIEIQNNAAGAAHSGAQHVELDSTNPSVMSQTITTVAGEKYRLEFWHSPRPNRPANDNAIGYEVQVVSGASTIISGEVGTGVAGTGSTNWTKYTYDFIAVDASTKIIFSDESPSNTFGGYLDDVAVTALDCEAGAYTQTPGGFCQLWEATDLTTETFFNFTDVKPQDSGMNVISLHVDSNDAYACLNVVNKEDNENFINNPEADAGDISDPQGELGSYLKVAGFYSDVNGNQNSVLFPPTAVKDLGTIAYADSNGGTPIAGNTTQYIKLNWCMGNFNPDGSCDGDVPDINRTQTDSFVADLKFSAIQTRNNDGYVCPDILDDEEVSGDNL